MRPASFSRRRPLREGDRMTAVGETPWVNAPWEHPDRYDIHDTTWTAGPEREPEHYRELVISLPPLDAGDHLLDAGCGTGKLAALVARGYPKLGRVTLLEPNALKLERAVAKLRELLPKARVDGVPGSLGESAGVTGGGERRHRRQRADADHGAARRCARRRSRVAACGPAGSRALHPP